MPYLDDDQYIMQKMWNEKKVMKERILKHDEYMRLELKDLKNPYKRGLRKTFNHVDQLPETIVRKAKQTGSQ